LVLHIFDKNSFAKIFKNLARSQNKFIGSIKIIILKLIASRVLKLVVRISNLVAQHNKQHILLIMLEFFT